MVTITGCFGQGEDQADAFMLSAPANDGPVLFRFQLATDPGATGCFEFMGGDRDRHDRPYTLTVQAEPVADVGEPNQTPDTATALALGAPQDASFATPLNGPNPEMDVYRVEVPRKGKLAIVVENVDPTIQLAARISNPAGVRLVEKGAANAGATLRIEQKVAKPGPFFIELRNIAGAGTPAAGVGEPPQYLTGPYRITASLE